MAEDGRAAGAEIRVELGDHAYPIRIGSGAIESAGAWLGGLLPSRRAVLLTDANLLATPWPERLEASLAGTGFALTRVVVPAGEASKSLATLDNVLDQALEAGVERRTALIALGGGVVGDLGGFAAAVALRGIPYVQVPTTLLAQVDSAVGGKTGVNSRHGKNLIGCFHQPAAVVIDTDTLSTLPPRELRAGYAEVVKYGCIEDAGFFAWLEANGEALLGGDVEAASHAIRRSLEIKARIVAADERETSGLRALLNFGHTFAHAYEALAGYGGRLLHGEAVSLGMVQAAKLSVALGSLGAGEAARIEDVLAEAGLPVRVKGIPGPAFDPDELLRAMSRDKKVTGGRIGFVVLEGLGRARSNVEAPLNLVRRILEEG